MQRCELFEDKSEKSEFNLIRGAPDPDPDPARYPVNLVDPGRIWIRPDLR